MIKKYLTQRYPSEGNKWQNIIAISIFVGLFMMIFQPFGLSELKSDNKMVILAGYGMVTFIILIINQIILPALLPATFSDERWTVLKELLFLLWVIFTLGLGNLLYSSWTLGFSLTLVNTVLFQAYTLAVGVIPVTTLILIKQNYLKKKNEGNALQIAATLSSRSKEESGNQAVCIPSDNEKDEVELMIKDLLFIKSDGNYITVGYLKEGNYTKTMLRNTLKNTAEILSPYPFIFQCHRSWLVNLDRISSVAGNSQGLRIMIEGYEGDIPVARNQSAGFKEKITYSS